MLKKKKKEETKGFSEEEYQSKLRELSILERQATLRERESKAESKLAEARARERKAQGPSGWERGAHAMQGVLGYLTGDLSPPPQQKKGKQPQPIFDPLGLYQTPTPPKKTSKKKKKERKPKRKIVYEY